MEIRLQAQTECTDGVCGHLEYILVNPITDRMTHLVVKEDDSPHTEYMVPVDFVTAATADTIQLRCSKVEMEKMDPFIQIEYVQETVPDYSEVRSGVYGTGTAFYLPYVTPEKIVYESTEFRQIPPDELAVQRGTRVMATDGFVGKVDELMVNPENGHITHLVIREGHLWGRKDVVIPLSAVNEPRRDTVSLNLDKHQIESLPTVPIHRRWA